jgi:hypothetical protein
MVRMMIRTFAIGVLCIIGAQAQDEQTGSLTVLG